MVMPAVSPVTTIEELLALPEDGQRHELLDGVHVVTPSPAYRHQDVLSRLMSALLRAVDPHPGLRVLTSPADIVLGPRTLVQPDLFVVRIDPEHPPVEWTDVGLPRLAVEILSPSTAARDRGAKRRIYQAAGVAEYWIVDLDARLIERWTPGDTRPEILTDGVVWEPEAGVRVEVGVGGVFGG